mmetsp:Transcript_144780/g.252416  ORF Transcript_144780/g.252416 Transcript_144780/m.252416 type:complete len:95 (+) Transcript_144780:150-434(+)
MWSAEHAPRLFFPGPLGGVAITAGDQVAWSALERSGLQKVSRSPCFALLGQYPRQILFCLFSCKGTTVHYNSPLHTAKCNFSRLIPAVPTAKIK